MKYLLNEGVVLFHPVLDKENSYVTIVCSPNDGNFHRVNQLGYWTLKFLDEHPKSSLGQVVENVALKIHTPPWQIEKNIRNLIAKMMGEAVILEKNE